MGRSTIATDLVDVGGVSLDQIVENLAALKDPVDRLIQQVERSRFNIGSSSPPGRAD